MVRKTTIHDIARELNTTAATVSRALNDNPRISEKTRIRVKELAKKIGYEPNHLAAALRTGKSKTIGVIVPFTDRAFFSSVIRGIEEVLNVKGYNVLICQSHDNYEDEIRNINALLQARVSGIVVSISKESVQKKEHLQKVIDQKVQLIMFDRVSEHIDCSSVLIDDFKGGYDATSHLIQSGFNKVLCFYSDLRLNIYRERMSGYRESLSKNNLDFIENMAVEIPSSIEAGRSAVKEMLSKYSPPFGLFCTSDYSALGAMQYLKETGIRVPEDIGIVGFSNEPFTQYLDPPLSTIDQKSHLMGEVIGKTFMERLGNKGTAIPKRILLKPELIVRGSSFKII